MRPDVGSVFSSTTFFYWWEILPYDNSVIQITNWRNRINWQQKVIFPFFFFEIEMTTFSDSKTFILTKQSFWLSENNWWWLITKILLKITDDDWSQIIVDSRNSLMKNLPTISCGKALNSFSKFKQVTKNLTFKQSCCQVISLALFFQKINYLW